jgi:hypothetical protein
MENFRKKQRKKEILKERNKHIEPWWPRGLVSYSQA